MRPGSGRRQRSSLREGWRAPARTGRVHGSMQTWPVVPSAKSPSESSSSGKSCPSAGTLVAAAPRAANHSSSPGFPRNPGAIPAAFVHSMQAFSRSRRRTLAQPEAVCPAERFPDVGRSWRPRQSEGVPSGAERNRWRARSFSSSSSKVTTATSCRLLRKSSRERFMDRSPGVLPTSTRQRTA